MKILNTMTPRRIQVVQSINNNGILIQHPCGRCSGTGGMCTNCNGAGYFPEEYITIMDLFQQFRIQIIAEIEMLVPIIIDKHYVGICKNITNV